MNDEETENPAIERLPHSGQERQQERSDYRNSHLLHLTKDRTVSVVGFFEVHC